MDFYELKNKYFSLVRKKMINDYKMGNIDFMESEELLDHIIERIGMYQDHGKSDDESIASAFRDFHGKLLALRPLTLGYTVGASYDGQSTIPGAEYVSVFRGLVGTEFADESMATKFAERDGVKLIFGFPPIPDGLYVDTEKNRKIIEEYHGRSRRRTGGTGRSGTPMRKRWTRCWPGPVRSGRRGISWSRWTSGMPGSRP